MTKRMTTGLATAALALAVMGATVVPPTASASETTTCAISWGSLPKAAELLPSTGTMTNVRAGRHDCYDRMVLDGTSFLRAEYVDQVRADGSGAVVPLRGGAKLQIVTTTAFNSETGVLTYRPTNPRELVGVTGWTTFRQVAWAGDFEGQATIGLGVRARLPFRVFALPGGTDGPARTVIDVAHVW